ncbi:helix-turn-helix domain-containing protein [Micrococcus luteus]|nr:helix-turn-helix domain-containing protein [Micrococcus luteus]
MPRSSSPSPATAAQAPNLTSPEAAAWLAISPQTLRNWRAQGRGPAFRRSGRPGARVYYRLSDLEAWVESQTTTLGGAQ